MKAFFMNLCFAPHKMAVVLPCLKWLVTDFKQFLKSSDKAFPDLWIEGN
jgi:hypothetical protein